MSKHPVSRIMSTQHPDNVRTPFFSANSVIEGDEEIKECYYVFSHLNIDEQLWDMDGKEVDNFVVKKLLSKYQDYFHKTRLGKDKFITLRILNPEIERNESKLLMECLSSIPRHYDIAKEFYSENNGATPPIFEVAIPMCSSEEIVRFVHHLYQEHIAFSNRAILGTPITRWMGQYYPETIRIIPLFETKEAILNADKIVTSYLNAEKVTDYQRVWLARSDPALNYGSTATVLLLKIALQRLYTVQRQTGIDILPVIGCGTAPFRGNFSPLNTAEMIKEYPSCFTFTAQSAFKYDFSPHDVLRGVEKIRDTPQGKPALVDENIALQLIDKMEKDYAACLHLLHETINKFAALVPPRRKRKLHIDLFGYARSMAHFKLPRAIPFCGALYSLGLPPDLFGVSALSAKELETVRQFYPSIDQDIQAGLQYLNEDNLHYFPQELKKRVDAVKQLFDITINEEHKKITSSIAHDFAKGDMNQLHDDILKAGHVRHFLG